MANEKTALKEGNFPDRLSLISTFPFLSLSLIYLSPSLVILFLFYSYPLPPPHFLPQLLFLFSHLSPPSFPSIFSLSSFHVFSSFFHILFSFSLLFSLFFSCFFLISFPSPSPCLVFASLLSSIYSPTLSSLFNRLISSPLPSFLP